MPKVSEEKVQVMKLSEKLMLFSLYLKDLKPKYLLLAIEFFGAGKFDRVDFYIRRLYRAQ